MTIAPGVVSLGLRVIAEHPAGHRITGRITGCGTNGVILDAAGLRSEFLSYERGWSVRLDPDAPQPADSAQAGER